jgi:hypothetical protein
MNLLRLNKPGEDEMNDKEIREGWDAAIKDAASTMGLLPNDDIAQIQVDIAEIKAILIKLTAPKKKPVARSSKDVYPDWFEELWKAYPKRAGSNPKGRAWFAAQKRNDEYLEASPFNSMTENEGSEIFRMMCGIERYVAFCEATGKTGTELVLQAATFFGPDRHYSNDYTIPKVKPKFEGPETHDAARKTFIPDQDTTSHLDPVDPYADMK